MATNLPQARLPVINDDNTFSLPWLRFFQGITSGTIDPAVIAALEAEIAAAEAAAAAAQATANEALIIAEEAEAGISPAYGITFAALDEPWRTVNSSVPMAVMFGLDGEPGADGISIPGAAGSNGTIGRDGAAGIGIPGMDGEDGSDTFYLLSSGGSSGTVTHTAGALTSGQLIIGNGAADIKVGDLSGDVSTSGSTVTTIGALKVATGMIQASAVTYAKIQNVSANSVLLGAGASGSGAAPVEIALGTNLSMSGATLNASGGGMTLLSTVSGSGTTKTVSFSGFSAAFANLRIVGIVQTTYTGSVTETCYVKLNSDATAANYTTAFFYGWSGAAFGGNVPSTTSGAFAFNAATQSGGVTTSYAAITVDLPGYNLALFKDINCVSNVGSVPQGFNNGAQWLSTAAITNIVFTAVNGNFTTLTTFYLYGY